MTRASFLLRCTKEQLDSIHAAARANGKTTRDYILSLCLPKGVETSDTLLTVQIQPPPPTPDITPTPPLPVQSSIPLLISSKPKYPDLCTRCTRMGSPSCIPCKAKYPPTAHK